MPNQLYQDLEKNNPQNPQNNFNNFMQNPFGFLASRQINIPQQFQNDPHGAVQYLLNNGQMNQVAFNKIFNTLQRMGFKFN